MSDLTVGKIVSLPPADEPLTEWEKRLLAKVRLLRLQHKSAKLLVEVQGPAILFWRLSPDGRVE